MKRIFIHFLLLMLTFSLSAQFLNWNYESIATDVQQSGMHPDMIIDPTTGDIHVSFWDENSDRLVYAHRTKSTYTWAIEYPDMVDFAGYASAITLDANGKVHIAYYKNDVGTAYLKYATNKTGTWVATQIADTALGYYGLDALFGHNFVLSVDIAIRANGQPAIVCFDASTSDIVIPDCPYTNYDLNIFCAIKNNNTWNTYHVPHIPGDPGICNSLYGDRFGEFLQLQAAPNGRYDIITNSYLNGRVISFRSTDNTLTTWAINVIDDEERFLPTNPPDGLSYAFRSFEYLQSAKVSPDSSDTYIIYGYSDFFGEQFTDNKKQFYIAKAKMDSLGQPNYTPVYEAVYPNSSTYPGTTYRSQFAIAPVTDNLIYIAYQNVTTSELIIEHSSNAMLSWTKEILASGFHTNSQLEMGIYRTPAAIGLDSLYVLIYDDVENRLKMAVRNTDPTLLAWKWENITYNELRGNYIGSQIARNAGVDKIHFAYDERYAGQVQYAYKDGNSAWITELIESNNVQPADVKLTLKSATEPIVVYAQRSNNHLVLARKAGTNWVKTSIDSTHQAREIATVYASNKVHVAYYDLQEKMLLYTNGAANATTWTSEVLDSSSNMVGRQPDMVAETNGNLHLTYIDSDNGRLKYAFKTPAGNWTIDIVTSPNYDYICASPSIKVTTTGVPIIAFYASNQNKMYLAEKINGVWTISLARDFLSSSIYANPLDLVLDSINHPWILYNYPNNFVNDMRLTSRDAYGLWFDASVINNDGQISNTFDFHIVGNDFYILGKKNALDDNGVAMMNVSDGSLVDLEMLAMQQNDACIIYPNPAQSEVNFKIKNPHNQSLAIRLYDLNGILIHTLTDGICEEGEHIYSFSAQDLPAGMYVCVWTIGNRNIVQKWAIVRH